MEIKKIFSSFITLAMVTLANPANAQQAADESAKALIDAEVSVIQPLKSSLESMTLLNLYAANNVEIELAKMALNKSNNKEIQDYAKMIIRDHTRENARIVNLSQAEDVSLVTLSGASSALLTSGMAQTLATISMLSDMDFDKAYLNTNIVLHLQTIAQMTGARMLLLGGPVEGLVKSVLPKLVVHLATATKIRNNLE